MRPFRRVVTIQPGGLWPEQEATANIPHFAWMRFANRGAPGSGNDIWVSLLGPFKPGDKPDQIIYAGTEATSNVEPASDTLHLWNVGASAVDVEVELSTAHSPIVRYRDAVNPSISVVTGATVQASQDGLAPAVAGQVGQSESLVYNGATWDRLRTPSVFKYAFASTVAATAVWTPAAGKRFRLMRLRISVPSDATSAVAGRTAMTFLDGGTLMPLAFDASVPTVGATGPPSLETGWIDLGNGILSAAANNVLTVALTNALTTSGFRMILIGTEE